jgi:hypothetical protein
VLCQHISYIAILLYIGVTQVPERADALIGGGGLLLWGLSFELIYS